MTFSNGSLILVDYTAKIKDTGEVFETTNEVEAVKHGIAKEGVRLSPRLVSVDDNTYPVLKGFNEALTGMSVGDKITVEVPPEKGFGERNKNNVRMIPIRKLGDDADKVTVGDTVEVNNKKGIIRIIGSGRVQIDYNHKYAGKTIVYDINVLQSLESAHDKINAILTYRLGVNTDVAFDLSDKDVKVHIPSSLYRHDKLQYTKNFIQIDIFKFIPTLEKIIFIETFTNRNLTPKPDISSSVTSPGGMPGTDTSTSTNISNQNTTISNEKDDVYDGKDDTYDEEDDTYDEKDDVYEDNNTVDTGTNTNNNTSNDTK
ncbi:MAG: peptidylprolyl isomerase [Thaumarchaeota archaeon]|nr:peptidylprolyl isomerase [Nitrososphaerota archaeon]